MDKELKTNYEVDTNCGKMNVTIHTSDLAKHLRKCRISATMEKFGDCAAYEFISDRASNLATTAYKAGRLDFAAVSLKAFACKNDGKGCIEVIGECLEKHIIALEEQK